MKLHLPPTLRKALLSAFAVTAAAALTATFTADAASYSGTSDWNWNNAANWTPGTVPNASGAVAEFDTRNNPALKGQTINLSSNVTVGRLSGSGVLSLQHDLLTIAGSTIIFDNGAGEASLYIENGLELFVDSDLRLNSNLKLDNASNHMGIMRINGAINLNGKTLTAHINAGLASSEIHGIISGGGMLVKTGAGKLVLSGANTFTGGVSFSEGTIVIEHDSVFGATAGTVTLTGAQQKTFEVSSEKTILNALVLDSTAGSLAVTGGGTLNFNGTAGVQFQSSANTNISVAENTTLTFGSGNAISSSRGIVKVGDGTLILGSKNNSFTSLTVNKGVVTTSEFTGNVVLGSASSGANILGSGIISVNGTGTPGDNVRLILNGGAGSTTSLAGTINVIDGASLVINSETIKLTGGILNFGSGTYKGDVTFNGEIWLGSTTLQNSTNAGFSFSGDIRFMNGSTIASTSGLFYDLIGTGTQRLVTETTGASLTIAGLVNQKGSGTTTVGSIGTLRFGGGLNVSDGIFDFGTFASNIHGDGGITLATGGGLAFGKDGQYKTGTINVTDEGLLLFQNTTQTLPVLNIANGGKVTVDMGSTGSTANFTTVNLGTNALFKIQDWTSADTVKVANAIDLNRVWFYGYNIGAAKDPSGVLNPVDRLTVEFANLSVSGAWRWDDAANWRMPGTTIIDDFNIPNAAGVKIIFNNSAGDLGGKSVDLGGNTWTIGHLDYTHTTVTNSGTSLNNGSIIFDSGIAGQASVFNSSSYQLIFNNKIYLNNDLIINHTTGHTQIQNGIEVLSTASSGNIYKRGGGAFRVGNIGFGSYDGDLHLEAGSIMVYGNNLLGTGTLVFDGGHLHTQFVHNKYTVSNKLQIDKHFTTYRINYTYNGDVDLGSANLTNGNRIITVSSNTNVAGERASATFGQGLNFTGTSGLEKRGTYEMEMLGNNHTFSGGLLVSQGTLFTTLRSDLTLGSQVAGENYLGAGNVTASQLSSVKGNIAVATEGYNSYLRGSTLAVRDGGTISFEGGGDVYLNAGTLDGGTGTSGTLVSEGDLIFGGTAVANSPNITLRTEDETELKVGGAETGITGIGVLAKEGTGTSTIGANIQNLNAGVIRISGGILKLGASDRISGTANLLMSGGLLDANGMSQSFNELQLTADSGFLLGNTGKLTFASVSSTSWSGTAQLNIQSSDPGDWLTNKYVRILDATNLDAARLANISFTGYETGAVIVNNGGYSYLTPSGGATIEWVGNGGTSSWGDAANWVGGVPNNTSASASIRDIDGSLSGKTILVDGTGYTINRLNLESTGGQVFTIGGSQSLTFDGTDAAIKHVGGSIVNLAASMVLASETTMKLLVDPATGYLNMSGSITSAQGVDLIKEGPGTLRISGNSTAMAGDFVWKDSSLIQVASNGTTTPRALFGAGTFHIGKLGPSGELNTNNYYIEAYGTDSAMAKRSSFISTDFSLAGNLIYQKQTENGVPVAESIGNNQVRLSFTGNGIIQDGVHTVDVWADTPTATGISEYLRLSFEGNLTGTGDIIKTGMGRLDFYGTDNSAYTGTVTLSQGYVYTKHSHALGSGTLVLNAPGVTYLYLASESALTLNNPLKMSGGTSFLGSTLTFDYDGTAVDNSNNPIYSEVTGVYQMNVTNTVVFGRNHAITGTGEMRKGQPGSYSGGGTIRYLGSGSTYSGGTTLNSGGIQIGADSVWKDDGTGTATVWKNGILTQGTLVSGPIGTGKLNLGQGGTFSSYGEGSGELAHRISNEVVLSSQFNIGRAGTATTTIFDVGEIKLKKDGGISGIIANVGSGSIASFESKLVNDTNAGGITKIGAGVLELANADNEISAGILASAGTVRAASYNYVYGSDLQGNTTGGTEVLGISTGDVTVGAVVSGQNYFGQGVLYTGASTAAFEVLTTDGSTVTIARRADGQDTLLLNFGGKFNVKGGSGIITELGNGLVLRTTEGDTGTISSTGIIRTDGEVNLGIYLDTDKFEVTQNGVIKFGQANVLDYVSELTLRDGGTLMVGANNQKLGGILTVSGEGNLDFRGYSVTPAEFTLQDIALASGAGSSSELKVHGWIANPTTGEGIHKIIIDGITQSKQYSFVDFGDGFTQGGVARYLSSSDVWVLTPMGTTYYWDGRNDNVWSNLNWDEYLGGSRIDSSVSPNMAGIGATFDDTDASLGGKTVSLGNSDIRIGNITISRTTADSFTIGQVGGSKFIMDGGGAGVGIFMTNGSNASVTIDADMQLTTPSAAEAGKLPLTIDHNGSGLLTINGVIEGNQAVFKTGTGTLVLNGKNRFTEGFYLEGGKVQIGVDGDATSGALGQGIVYLEDGVTLEALNGARLLTSNGMEIRGDITIIGDLSFTDQSMSTEMKNNASINLAGTGDILRNANSLTGTGILTKTGSGLLELTGNSTAYAAGIVLDGGTIAVGSTNGSGTNMALGTGALTFRNNAVLTNVTSVATAVTSLTNNMAIGDGKKAEINTDGGDLLLSGNISGATGILEKTGDNVLSLSGANTYGGGTSIVQGGVRITTANAAGLGAVTVNNGTSFEVALVSAGTVANAIANAGIVNVTGNGTTLSGIISGSGAINISGKNTTISGANTTDGQWTITSTGGANFSSNGNFGTSAIQVDGTLASIGTGSIVFDHVLTGTGMLNIGNSGSFGFGSGVGSAFAGTVNVYDGTFAWDAAASTALTNAALALHGNSLTQMTGNQSAEKLIMDGGRLDFGSGKASVTDFEITTNGGRVVFDQSRLQASGLVGQDKLTTQTLLTSANAWTGSVSDLSLAKTDGTAIGTTSILDIVQNSLVVAKGTYANTLTRDNNDLVLNYKLNELTIQAGRTLELAQETGNGAETFDALIKGINATSNLVLKGGAAMTDTLELTYATLHIGSSSIASGTILAGSADTFKANSGLNLTGSDAVFNLNGNNQEIRKLDGVAGSQILLGTSSLTVNGSGDGDFAGVIDGTGSVTKAGTGTMILSGNNTYTGLTTISGGKLQLGNGGNMGIVAGNIANNAALEFNYGPGASISYSGIISGTGTVAKTGAGTVILNQSNTYNGATTITAGVIKAGTDDIIASSSSLTISDNGKFDLDSTDQTVRNLTATEAGKSAQVALGIGTLTVSNSVGSTFNGVISGSGSVVKTGNGTLTIANSQAYTGDTVINGGVLEAAVNNIISSSSSLAIGDGGRFSLNNTSQTVNNLTATGAGKTAQVTLGNGSLTVNNSADTTFNGVISGTGTVTKTGDNTLTLSNSNTYTGATSIEGGTVKAGANNVIAGSGSLDIANGAEFDVNGTSQSVKNLSGAAGSSLALGTNGSLAVNSVTNTTFAGAISGSGDITKTGAGTWTLSGASSYSGTTTVDAGLLKLTNSQATGTSSVTVNASAAGTGLELAFSDAAYSNSIGGAGLVTISGQNVTLSGTNTLSGTWNVTGSAIALAESNLGTATVNLNGAGSSLTLRPATASNWNFTNALTGEGTLKVDLGEPVKTLTMGAGVGSAFTGTLDMMTGHLMLDSNAASALANATLKLTSSYGVYMGGTAEVTGSGVQTIKKLEMSGGTLQINFTGKTPDAVLKVTTLDTSGGGYIAANGLTGLIDQSGASSSNFFEDSGSSSRYQIKVVDADYVMGSTQLQLVDENGIAITGGAVGSSIIEGGVATGTAYYDYLSTTGTGPNGEKGVFIGYGLKEIEANNGRQVTLANGTSVNTLDAKLTGAGGFIVNGTGTVKLGNAASDYTGATNVNSGAVQLQTSNAFGQTSHLAIAGGASVSLISNSQTQSVGQLTNAGTVNLAGGTVTVDELLGSGSQSGELANTGAINLQGGTLNLTNGGTSTGTLAGAGKINLSGGELDVDGPNSGLSAQITIEDQAKALLDDYAGLGTGKYNLAGELEIDGAAGTLGNAVAFDGGILSLIDSTGTVASTFTGNGATINVTGTSDIRLTGTNNVAGSYQYNIGDGSRLTVHKADNIGNARIQLGGTFVLDYANTNIAWTLNNELFDDGIDTGELVKQGNGTVVITRVNDRSGETTIKAGGLELGNVASLGSGSVNVETAGSFTLQAGATGTFANGIANNGIVNIGSTSLALGGSLTGAGQMNVLDGARVALNTSAGTFTGNWDIKSGSAVTMGAAGNIGSGAVLLDGSFSLNQATAGDYTWNNALTGSGILNVNLVNSTDNFDFASTAGTGFRGTLDLISGTIDLGGTGSANTGALGKASFRIESAGTAVVTSGSGINKLGNLELNGGTISFVDARIAGGNGGLAPDYISLIDSQGRLKLNGGNIAVDAQMLNGIDTSSSTTANLLVQDDGKMGVKLIETRAGYTEKSGTELLVIDSTTGQIIPLDNTERQFALKDGSITIGTGYYNFGLGIGDQRDGLYVTYKLTRVDIDHGKTLKLANDSSSSSDEGSDFNAQITGTGNLELAATTSEKVISLSNVNNTFTGDTAVTDNTILKAKVDNIIQYSSSLTLGNNSEFQLNGTNQKVANLQGAGRITMNNSKTLTVDNDADSEYAGVISGKGNLVKQGDAMLTLTGDNNFTGGTTRVEEGTLQLGNGGTSGIVATGVELAQGTNLIFNRSDDVTYDKVVSGQGSLAKKGDGKLILVGDSTYRGTTTIEKGELQIGNGSGYGSILAMGNSGASVEVQGNATLSFNLSTNVNYAGSISGAGEVIQRGTGILSFTTAQNYTGGSVIEKGTLKISGNGSVGTSGETVEILSTGKFHIGEQAGAYTLVNTIAGNGTMIVDLGETSGNARSMNFGSSAGTYGTAFGGTLEMRTASYVLGDDMQAFLNTGTAANLTTKAGSLGSLQKVNNSNVSQRGRRVDGTVTFDGGTMSWKLDGVNQPEAWLDAGAIAINQGSGTAFKVEMGGSLQMETLSDSLFGSSYQIALAKSDTVITGSAAWNNVKLTANGNEYNSGSSIRQSLIQGNETIAKGQSQWNAYNSDYELGIEGRLNRVEIFKDKTLNVTLGSGTSNKFSIVLADYDTYSAAADVGENTAGRIGSGSVVFTDNRAVKNGIRIQGTNSYTGKTTVSAGTKLILENIDSALGSTDSHTSELVLAGTGSELDLNGNVANIGRLTMGAGSSLDLNSGILNIVGNTTGTAPVLGGGTVAGNNALTGIGNINLGLGTLSISGSNANVQAATEVASGATLVLNAQNALGDASHAGAITVQGTLETGYAGTLNNLLIGGNSQSLWNKKGAGTLVSSKDNTYGGSIIVSEGTLSLTGSNDNIQDTELLNGTTLELGQDLSAGSGDIRLTGNTGTIKFLDDLVLSNDISVSRMGNLDTDGNAVTAEGLISGNGGLAIVGGGTLTIDGSNTFNGNTAINNGTTVVLAENSSDGLSSGNITLSGGSTLELAFDSETFDNKLSGTSTETVLVSGEDIVIAADNRNFAGTWDVEGSASISGTAANVINNLGSGSTVSLDGGTLSIDVANNSAFTFANKMNGNGRLEVALGDAMNQFRFNTASVKAGGAFTGTLAVNKGQFIFSNEDKTGAGVLSSGTLELGADGSVLLDGDYQIGGLAMEGGTLRIDTKGDGSPKGMLEVSDLSVNGGGTVALHIPDSISKSDAQGTLFDDNHNIDDVYQVQLVQANGNVTQGGAQLQLTNRDGSASGNPLTNYQVQLKGNGVSDVAEAYYDYIATVRGDAVNPDDNGIYLGYGLSRINSYITGNLYTLDNTGASNNVMGAQLTSTAKGDAAGGVSVGGGFEFASAGNTDDTMIKIGNAANNYTGDTLVSSGTVKYIADNAFGKTGSLTLASGTTVDMNGMKQIGDNAVKGALTLAGTDAKLLLNGGRLEAGGAVTVADSNKIDLGTGNGELTLNGGGSITGIGALNGAGTLNLSGTNTHLVVSGANSGLTATVNVNSGNTVTLDDFNGLGSGQVNLKGTYEITNATGTLANTVKFEGGVLNFDNAQGTQTGVLTGSGAEINLANGSDIVLNDSGATGNRYLAGTFNIDDTSRLTATRVTSMGTADVKIGGELVLNYSDTDAWILTNNLTDNGAFAGTLTKEGTGKVVINKVNNRTGDTAINGGEIRLGDLAGLGAGDVAIAGSSKLSFISTANGIFNNDLENEGTVEIASTDLSLGSDISGSGEMDILGNAVVEVTGDNAAFDGVWNIGQTADVTIGYNRNLGDDSKVSLDGTLHIDRDSIAGDYIWKNELEGGASAILDVELSSNTDRFIFDSGMTTGAGSDFEGTLRLGRGTFDLEGDHTEALTKATLESGQDNKTIIGAGSGKNSIGGLILNGGYLDFSTARIAGGTGVITDDHVCMQNSNGILHIKGGTVAVDASITSGISTDMNTTANLLVQDDGEMGVQLVSTNDGKAMGGTAELVVVDSSTGEVIDMNGQDRSFDITTGGSKVATGYYNFGTSLGANNNGLHITYKLIQVDLENGATLKLDNEDATGAAADFSAYITGSGNLLVDASGSANKVISLSYSGGRSNNVNDFTGTTTVTDGTTLQAAVDNIISYSKSLILGNGSTFDMNGTNQKVNGLTGGGEILFNGDVTLTLNNETNQNTQYVGDISGQGGIEKTGAGEILLTGTIDVERGIAVNEGEVQLIGADYTASRGAAITLRGSGSAVIDGGTLNGGGGVLFSADSASGSLTVANISQIGNDGQRLLDAYGTGSMEFVLDNISDAKGDIYAASGAMVNLTLKNNTTLTGKIDPVTVNVQEGSTWNITADSSVVDLNTSGTINFMEPSGKEFKTLTVQGSMANDKGAVPAGGLSTGTINMNVSLSDMKSDLVTIGGNVTGNYKINIKRDMMNDRTDQTKFSLLLVDVDGSNSGSAEGSTEFPLFYGSVDIGMKTATVQAGDLSGNNMDDWYLVYDISREGPGSNTSRAVLASAEITQGWFAQSDSLQNRMGELRLNQPLTGCYVDNAWVRTYGGEYNTNSKVAGQRYNDSIFGSDVGMDKGWQIDSGNRVYTGVFGGLADQRKSFDVSDGMALVETDSFNIGGYATWLSSCGAYADFVIKAQRFDNELSIFDSSNNRTTAKYGQWAVGASIETGQMVSLNDSWYLEPSVQVSYMHGLEKSYTTRGINPFDISIGSSNVLRGKAGITVGRNVDLNNNGKLQTYARVDVVQQFSEGGRVHADGGFWNPNMDGTSIRGGAGLIWQIDSRNQVHVGYDASVGEKATMPWSVNLGYRYQF